MKRHLSPCLSCTRVADPENCTDKTCRLWQSWFLEQWDLIHAFYRGQMSAQASQQAGHHRKEDIR